MSIVCPPWMGYSWYEFDTDIKYYYLLPFNWIVRWMKKFWYNLRWYHAAEGWDGRINRQKVWLQGYEEGHRCGWNDAIVELKTNGWQHFTER